MDPTSQTNINYLEAQLREVFARVVWTHKTQEKCSDIVLKTHKRIKFWQILLSALTTTGILIAIFGDSKAGLIISFIFSTILFALNTYTKDYDLGEISQKHSNTALDLWNIREEYLSLLTDLKQGSLSNGDIAAKRDELQNKLYNIYNTAPRTNSKAYKLATKALKLNEELSFTDEEIDLLLPRELRKIEN